MTQSVEQEVNVDTVLSYGAIYRQQLYSTIKLSPSNLISNHATDQRHVVDSENSLPFTVGEPALNKHDGQLELLYKNRRCETPFFSILTGITQRFILSPFLHILIIDSVFKKTVDHSNMCIRWSQQPNLRDLNFAGDTVILVETPPSVVGQWNRRMALLVASRHFRQQF
ncbi:uncharacterized protein LOC126474664 [Schistocerca serialis cubense]|uniref:uncharacterized protein LOC126474664 n=1 Tax=Schistocerca serialis cubense TaxID=2023355 RepID=UPI00214E6654|nr:uncharacterized protein LOC126474664 [Schistocerca serialis cubense]